MQNKKVVYGNPYFTNTMTEKPQYPYLNHDIETECLIIGGGVTGAIAAYYFSQANIKTVLVEKEIIGYGSTSITTTLLQYELDDNLDKLEKILGEENAITAYKACVDALGLIDNIAQEIGNTFDYTRRDTLLFSDKKKIKEHQSIQYEYELRKKHGFEVDYIDDKTSQYPFKLYSGVVSKNGGAELNPYLFTHALLKASIAKGLEVFEKTNITSIEDIDGYVIAKTAENTIKAKKVIVATGYFPELLEEKNFGQLFTTYNVVTKPLPEKNWPGNALLRTTDSPYVYIRTTKDHRIIIGGEDTHLIPDNLEDFVAQMKYQKLEKRLREMLNDKTIQFEYKYGGTFAVTEDNLGFIGPKVDGSNIYLDLGYGANGLLFAVIGAQILLDLYNGNENKYYEIFKVNR